MKCTIDPYVIHAEVPTVETYLRLRSVAGLSAKTAEAAQLGLPHSWHAVLVTVEGEPIAMGRIVGDGGCFFQVVDICVAPEHQGCGIGKRIMGALVEELERRAPAGAYVSLMADGDARHLYRTFGFEETAPASVGMYRTV